MALPRSTAVAAFAPSAVANMTFSNITFTSVTANTTTVFTYTVPQTFKPQRATSVVFTVQPPAGLVIGTPYISGNARSDGGANYSVNIPISNVTVGNLTPNSSTIRVFQD